MGPINPIIIDIKNMSNARKPRLYHPHNLQIESLIQLEPEAAQHITRVLRMNIGEEVILFDNRGGEYLGVIQNIKNKTEIYITHFFDCNRESPLKLHLGQSLARADRMDFIIQKATELGVDCITPLITARSMIKLDGKALDKKMQHWSNIIISAAQQCGRTHLPTLHLPIRLSAFVSPPFEGLNICFDPMASASLKSLLPSTAIRLLIGPESGLDESEMNLAMHHHFSAYTLGPRVLRTETASIAALCALQLLHGDLS